MGTNCCHPQKGQEDTDLRHKRSKKKGDRALEQNTFKRDAADPEFVVVRRDSLGMAAKDHTNQMLATKEGEVNHSQEYRKSLQSDLDTNKQANSQGNNPHVFTEGTFHVEAEIGRIQQMENLDKDSFVQVQPVEIKQHTESFGAVSFGAQNKFLDESLENQAAAASNKLAQSSRPGEFANSIVSIRDIQEVRDKVPASPATATKHEPKESHFQ